MIYYCRGCSWHAYGIISDDFLKSFICCLKFCFHIVSIEDGDFPVGDASANGGRRWRSDDTSEDEDQQNPFENGLASGGGHRGPMIRARRSRLRKK